MSPSIALVVAIIVMSGVGTYMLLERSVVRMMYGVMLLSNAVNLLLLSASGRGGKPPLLNVFRQDEMGDPLPHALILTAIVITLASAAFVLTLAYRSWQLSGTDEVPDDIEDRRIAASKPHRSEHEDVFTPQEQEEQPL